MASYKVSIRKDHEPADGLYPILITVYHKNKKERYPIGWKIPKDNWDEGKGLVKGNHKDKSIINSIIESKVSAAKMIIAECDIKKIPVPIGKVFNQVKVLGSFNDYLDHRAWELFNDGKIAIKQKIEDLSREIKECFSGDIRISQVNDHSVAELKKHFKKKGNKDGTVKKKFSLCTRFYDELIRIGKATAPNPFDGHKFKIVKPKKIKLTITEIDLLDGAILDNSNHRMAVDMFLFSYYCKGIRFENVATMHSKWIRDGRLSYQINKGLKHLSVKIHPKLQAIIDRYKSKDPIFIFPVFTGADRGVVLEYFKKPTNETKEKYKAAVNNRNTLINEWLWKAAKKVGVNEDISFHIARHTFAFHLKKVTSSIHVIKDALGHSTSQQTETYLKELEDDAVDIEVGKLYGS